MNYTSAWFAGWRGGHAEASRSGSSFSPILGASIMGLLLGLAASVWLYYNGLSSLVGTSIERIRDRPREEIRRHFDTGTRVFAPGLLGGAGLVLGLFAAASRKSKS